MIGKNFADMRFEWRILLFAWSVYWYIKILTSHLHNDNNLTGLIANSPHYTGLYEMIVSLKMKLCDSWYSNKDSDVPSMIMSFPAIHVVAYHPLWKFTW